MVAYPFRPHQLAPAVLDILVAEDDDLSRGVLVKALRELGHQCRAASNGDDAWRMIEEQRPDVVVSDWRMPGLSGVDLCRRARATDDAGYTYFILMTGAHDRDHLLAGMAAGADDFQKKPIDLDELEARLVSAARVHALHERLAERTEELRRDSKTFYRASRTDALTGAGNRRSLDEELAALAARVARYGHRCSIAMCDVDSFKAYNDRFGHVAGDEALRRVAGAIRANLRGGDSLFRYGGEELVVILHEQSADAAALAMERIRRAVEELGLAAASGGVLTMSVGVTELDADARASVERADEALYRAKAQGKNRVER